MSFYNVNKFVITFQGSIPFRVETRTHSWFSDVTFLLVNHFYVFDLKFCSESIKYHNFHTYLLQHFFRYPYASNYHDGARFGISYHENYRGAIFMGHSVLWFFDDDVVWFLPRQFSSAEHFNMTSFVTVNWSPCFTPENTWHWVLLSVFAMQTILVGWSRVCHCGACLWCL